MSVPPLPSPTPTSTPLLVACLCADWCGTCRDYQPQFMQLASQFPRLQFVWIDIEDEADWVDPIAVEDFPTILIASPKHAHFFGTVLPHIQTLKRLITTQLVDPGQALAADSDVGDLVAKLWQRAANA